MGNQRFALGDRVTYVSATGKVPVATRGTVVGIGRTATAILLDVVWDVSFMSGTTLGDRAPPFRGMTVASSSVLNTTNRQVVSGSKASAARTPARAAAGLTAGGYNPNGHPQYREAPAPAPLRGGWSGAAHGQRQPNRNGHQGANGGNNNNEPKLLHSSLVYRPHPNGNGHGQSQESRGRGGRGRGRGGHQTNGTEAPGSAPQQPMYSNVPPPAGLDSRGRGRGRGNGRGGGRGRGRGQGGAAGPQASN